MKLHRHPSRVAFAAFAFVLSCGNPDTSPTGTGGAPGSGGVSAAAGTTGAAGTSAAAGTTGTAGTNAAAGTTGTAGTNAAAGTTGAAGRGGTTGAAGRGGTTGTAGTVGAAGRGGTTGAAGTVGAAGRGGTSGGAAGRGGTSGGVAGAAGTNGGGTGGATPSSGCGKAPPASARYTIDVGGTMREYILAVPANYDQTRPYRLIFAWHPLGGSAQQTAGTGNTGYYGLRGASNNAAILVSAEGLPFSGSSLGWGNTGGRDIAFLRAMIERFKSEMCIDESRMFSTGFSFGGMMSNAVGCAGLARAIAPMAGSQISGCENGTKPVAVMGFHGDDDTVVSIASGRTARDEFVERNGCMTQTAPMQPSWCDGVSSSSQPCMCVTYQGCAVGYPVIWCEFNGPHTPAPSSAATIWNFFSQF